MLRVTTGVVLSRSHISLISLIFVNPRSGVVERYFVVFGDGKVIHVHFNLMAHISHAKKRTLRRPKIIRLVPSSL